MHTQFYKDGWFLKVCDWLNLNANTFKASCQRGNLRNTRLIDVIFFYCGHLAGLLFRKRALWHIFLIRVALRKYIKFQRKFGNVPAVPN
jgi:hypothetical protein